MTEWLHFHFSLSCIGEGKGNPFQGSCLENPKDGGAWWAAIYGVAQSWTRLKRLRSSSSSSLFMVNDKRSKYGLTKKSHGDKEFGSLIHDSVTHKPQKHQRWQTSWVYSRGTGLHCPLYVQPSCSERAGSLSNLVSSKFLPGEQDHWILGGVVFTM